MKKNQNAFSLIELSIVILIIGILIAGVTQSSRLIAKAKLNNARTLTESSPVSSIKDLSLWMETTSEKSFDDADTEDGNPVNNWYEINPQSSFKTQFSASTTDRPTYVASGINNIPALNFDGTANYMRANSHNVSSINPITIFIVVQYTALPGSGLSDALIAFPQNGQGWRLGCDNTSSSVVFTAWAIADSLWNNGCNNTNANIFEVSVDGTSGVPSFYRNGGSATTGVAAVPLPVSSAPITIGAKLDNLATTPDLFFNGKIGEIIIFNRVLKSEERTAIENYLGKKWGITIS